MASYQEGYDDGHEEGFNDGYEKGFEDGKASTDGRTFITIDPQQQNLVGSNANVTLATTTASATVTGRKP